MNTEDFSTQIENDELEKISPNAGFIGIAQINPIAGNLEYNAKKIAQYVKFAKKTGLNAIIFPKYGLLGSQLNDTTKRYPQIFKEEEKWLKGLAKIAPNCAVFIGYKNKTAILINGEILYNQITINNVTYSTNENHAEADIIIKSVSEQIHNEKAFQPLEKPTIYVNQVGATDNISYAGLSCVFNQDGKLIARAKAFEEQLLIVNPLNNIGKIYPIPQDMENSFKQKQSFSLDYEPEMERIYKTLVQGIKDYFNKCGLKRAVLGLSGGLDSTVAAVLLTDALGKENILGISMPSKLTSLESKSDARELAQNLGIHFIEQSIKPMCETTSECLNKIFNDTEKSWNGRFSKSFTPDNIQARSRAMYLWGVSNEFASCIPIATSDKSEAYMGYATINGDMSGGFAPIADVTKTKLFALARWMNKNRTPMNAIPESIILKKPGAELAIDPNTGKTLNAEDALMPYEFLDEIIWRVENKNETYEEMLNSKFIYEAKNNISLEQKKEWLNKFYSRMSTAIYKWSILPPSVIVEKQGINKAEYSQPITSGKINYKGVTDEYIKTILDSD